MCNRQRLYEQHLWKTCPQYRLSKKIRRRVQDVIRKYIRTESNLYLFDNTLQCELIEFKEHIEELWKPKMHWENYGSGRGKWCIDHVIPLSNFDLLKTKSFKSASVFTNTQPLWFVENIQKGNAV